MTNSCGIDRQTFLFGAFEREFRYLYGENYGRSSGYISVKSEIINELENCRQNFTGKKKDYINEIKRSVSKLNISLSDRLKAAQLSKV
jgi:hypothetical protein